LREVEFFAVVQGSGREVPDVFIPHVVIDRDALPVPDVPVAFREAFVQEVLAPILPRVGLNPQLVAQLGHTRIDTELTRAALQKPGLEHHEGDVRAVPRFGRRVHASRGGVEVKRLRLLDADFIGVPKRPGSNHRVSDEALVNHLTPPLYHQLHLRLGHRVLHLRLHLLPPWNLAHASR
jgi:hypothetical protein